MSIQGLSESDLLQQAREGDLRPQFNPHAVITWPVNDLEFPVDRGTIVSLLLNRFFELSRPIADAFREPGLHMRLGDAGRFFFLIASLEHLGYQGVEDNLLVFLDEFSMLEQASYDELYLWSIVELSRRHPRHIETFWPMVLTLDLRFRSERWRRPADQTIDDLVDWPYRLTELLLYFYVVDTSAREPSGEYEEREGYGGSFPVFRRRYPLIANCLRKIVGKLDADQRGILMESLQDLARLAQVGKQRGRASHFSDAHGLLVKMTRK